MELHFSMYQSKTLNSQKGFGIIEVMVAGALLMIIAAGMSSLFTNMQREQRRQSLMAVLSSKRTQFQNAITNDKSWQNTMNANASMACLKNQTACAATYVSATANTYSTSYTNIVLKDGAAAPGGDFYDGTLSGAGFTESGAACTGFTTAAAGNDACPIAYRVSWVAQSTAINPKIVVYIKMIYNPSDSNPFKTFLNATAASTVINDKYDVKLDRTAATISKSFMVGSQFTFGSGGSCAAAGYGTCSTSSAAYTVYPNLVEIKDDYDLVTITGGNTVSINSIGNYKCTMVTYAFATNDVTARLYQTSGTPTELGKTFSTASKSTWGYATVILDTNVQVTTSPTNIQIQQVCATTPGGADDNCALGFVGAPYPTSGTNVYRSTLNCVQVNER